MPRNTADQGEESQQLRLCACGCGYAPEGGHTYAGDGRAEQEAHRQRAVRRSGAEARAVLARQRAAPAVLARLDLTVTSTPTALAAKLAALAADASDLAALVVLEVAASDADVVRARVGEHARVVRRLEDRAATAEAATVVARDRIAELEVELEAGARGVSAARADAEAARLEAQLREVQLTTVRAEGETVVMALEEATALNDEVKAALTHAEAASAASQAEVREVQRALSTVHVDAAQAMAAQQACASALHAKELRAAVRRADEARRTAARDAQARFDALQAHVVAGQQAARDAHLVPRLIISRR